MALLTELEIVSRYRDCYGFSDAIGIQHVERHKELEAELTSKLLNSRPENRWQVFDDCYTTLFKNLPWLNEIGTGELPAKDRAWRRLLKKPSTIFEVGSGKGNLLRHLATLGHHCIATEVSVERSATDAQNFADLEWRITDGVNLAKFEPPETYDVVISSQVIEHFHPDDVQIHFDNTRIILKTGGEYIFDTPHVGAGPHDLSKVFGLDRPAFMHLREYDFRDLGTIARSSGFKKVQAILFYQFGRVTIGLIRSKLLFLYCCFVDYVLSAFRLTRQRERAVRRLLRLALVPINIWLVAQK